MRVMWTCRCGVMLSMMTDSFPFSFETSAPHCWAPMIFQVLCQTLPAAISPENWCWIDCCTRQATHNSCPLLCHKGLIFPSYPLISKIWACIKGIYGMQTRPKDFHSTSQNQQKWDKWDGDSVEQGKKQPTVQNELKGFSWLHKIKLQQWRCLHS